MKLQETKRPWYREPWVWLLIALPMSAVIGGIITIVIAVTTSDGLVVDDYYKRGKAINRDLARDRAAAQHRLEARFDIDADGRRIALRLKAHDYTLPEALMLSLLHPTRKGHDQRVQLVRTEAGRYTGGLGALLPGNWYVQLEADDWRLSGSFRTPADTSIVLSPQLDGDS
ncbi:MAG: FixH family protein [Gammaproteobacteria bacterium]|nr:FixH family protein [Gammaproteobacteria bacterium]